MVIEQKHRYGLYTWQTACNLIPSWQPACYFSQIHGKLYSWLLGSFVASVGKEQAQVAASSREEFSYQIQKVV